MYHLKMNNKRAIIREWLEGRAGMIEDMNETSEQGGEGLSIVWPSKNE